ncbi:DUF6674 family protein [Faecalicatena orotica]|uniref:DUF6674 family protein n=1 Tax=Faecalicatena orotica TaxID=1544 RepID=UPI003217B547
MAEQALALREIPQIMELFAVLEQNGLHKEKEEVSALVDYISTMENQVIQMMGELQEMHADVQKLNDKGLRIRCEHLLDSAQDKLVQIKAMVSTVKTNFLRAAGKALTEFKEKGRSALVQAVHAMKIPALLSKMKEAFRHGAQSMQEAAMQIDVRREQLHEAGMYMKNAGRVLVGKEAVETKTLEQDKGILAKVRKVFEGMAHSFTAMEQRTDGMKEKIPESKAEKKSSVKSELKALRAEHSIKKTMPLQNEQTR